MQLPMLPDRDHLAPHYFLQEPLPAVAVALGHALAVTSPLPWMVPFELGVVEPSSSLMEVMKNLQDLGKPHVLPPTSSLPFDLTPRSCRSVAHQSAPLSSHVRVSMPCWEHHSRSTAIW